METLRNTFSAWPGWLQALVWTTVAILLGWVIVQIVFSIIAANARRFDNFSLRVIDRRLRGPFAWLLPAVLASITLTSQADSVPAYLPKVATTLVYVAGAWVLIRIANAVADAVRRQYNLDEHDNLKDRKVLTQLQYIQRVIVIAIFFITAAFIMLQFEAVRQVGTGLLTSAGVAGIIIGVAAQRSIANLLAGFQIAFTQPIRLDDVVVVAGEWGRIEEITLTYVVIRSWDQRRIIVPLQYFNENIFQNWTRNTAELTGAVFLYTDYSIPVSAIRERVASVLAEHPKWDQRVQVVQVTDAKPEVIELRILVSATNSGDTFDLRCDVREQLIDFIREEYPTALPRTRVDLHYQPTMPDGQAGQAPVYTNSPTPEAGQSELPPQA